MRKLFLVVSLLFASLVQAQQLSIDVRTDSVRVSGAVRGGDVVIFSMGLGSDGYTPLIRRVVEVINDDDLDGEVVLRPTNGVLNRSAWVAVDVTNGQFATGAQPQYRLRVAGPGRHFKRGSRGLDEFVSPTGVLDVLYVHPGRGVWIGRANDGQANDADQLTNGKTAIRLSDMQPVVARSERPADFTPGGVIVAIDHYTLQLFTSRVDNLPREEGQP